MDFKSLLAQLDQLNEATEKTKTGLKHTAEPGGYGRKDDEDEEGNKVKAASTEKKGRGRPKKATQTSGEDKKYDFSAFGVKHGKDIKLPKHDKKKTTKHSLKEYFDAIDQEMLAEAEQIQIKPASQMPKMPGQTSIGQKPAVPGQQPVAGQPQKDTQVIAQGNKTLGTVDNPQLAQQIKQSIGKGEMSLAGDQLGEEQLNELSPELLKRYQAQADRQDSKKRFQGSRIADYKLGKRSVYGDPDSRGGKITARRDAKLAAAQAAGTLPPEPDFDPSDDFTSSMPPVKFGRMYGKTNEEDIGKHNNATTGFDALVKKLTPKYGVEAAKRIAGAQLKKIREADQPPNDSLMSPISEARAKADDKAEKAGKKVTKDLEYDMKHKGKDDAKAEKAGKKVTKDIEYDEKKKTVKEAAKPDFPDIDNDGNKKETIAKAAQDAKKDKKKVKEGMEHKLKSARHTGKAHALARESYNCKYDDMEEARHYHEGYKEGLDECYGQMPIQGYVGEANKEVADMASYGAHTLDEDGGQVAKQKVSDWLRDPRLDAQVMKLQVPGLNITNPQKGISGHDMYGGGMSNPLKDLYTDAKNPMYFKEFLSHIMKKLGDVVVTGTLQAGPAPAMEGDMDEGNAFTKALATTPPGGKFSLGGKTFTDRSGYNAKLEENPFAFESLEKQLNALLEGEEHVAEGMTVSISKGQQGQPDSVSVNAQDGEADQLLSIIKQAGLGLFGGDEQAVSSTGSQPMSVAVDSDAPTADIEVVDDHDDMLSLIRKMTGQGPATQAGDYEEEGGEEASSAHGDEEETCETCGESACGCGESVEEDETVDQREYEVAEDESGGDDSEESDEVNSDATRDAALAQAAGQNFADTDAPIKEGGDGGEAGTDAIAADDAADAVNAEEEDLDESYANGDDDTFETDIDFMTKVISGGLNKQKSTGQTTIPVIAGQNDRMGYNTNESVNDWKKLAGIK